MEVRRTVSGIPSGLTKAWLTIKTDKDDLDAAADLQKEITISEVVGTGHIEDAGAGGTATLRFDITGVETAALGYGRRYHYDIQVLDAGGPTSPDTIEMGTIQFLQGVTDATS